MKGSGVRVPSSASRKAPLTRRFLVLKPRAAAARCRPMEALWKPAGGSYGARAGSGFGAQPATSRPSAAPAAVVRSQVSESPADLSVPVRNTYSSRKVPRCRHPMVLALWHRTKSSLSLPSASSMAGRLSPQVASGRQAGRLLTRCRHPARRPKLRLRHAGTPRRMTVAR